eukprot:scaffold1704_cov246-Pinguiococcus_pyrenoidosus.AAC.8
MQIVIWFAGLRGAIAFALAQNIPGEHTDLYTTTTLAIVLFTTVVCGGLTEPLLGKMGMKLQHGSGVDGGDGSNPYESLVQNGQGMERRMSLADKVSCFRVPAGAGPVFAVSGQSSPFLARLRRFWSRPGPDRCREAQGLSLFSLPSPRDCPGVYRV